MTAPITRTPVTERTMAAVLERHAHATPNKPALIETTGRSVTYLGLQERSFSLAHGISDAGVQRQDTVLLMLDNHIDMVVACFGLGVSSTIAVPINTAYKGELLRYAIEHSGAKVAIVEDHYCGRIAQVLDETTCKLETVFVRGNGGELLPPQVNRRDFAELQRALPLRPEPPHVSDIAFMIYTSGTEGRSKGVLVPHGQAFRTAGAHSFTTAPEDVVLAVLPFFHIGGLCACVYNALRAGATAVIEPTFSVSRFWDTVRDFGCTKTELMGAMIEFLWRQTPTVRDTDHSLRDVTVIPAMPYIADFARRFGVRVHSAYGQTETGCPCVTDVNNEIRPSMCGHPRVGYEIRIVDEDDVEVAPGVTGEITVRSNEPWTLFRGYHRDLAATIHATRNGWVHTGDIGYQDEHGQLFFVDRKKDALRRRGENVSSMEVEKYLLARSDIAEAAIIAVPSEHLEDDIKAVVVLNEGAQFEPENILRDLVERLPYFMVPRYYEAIDVLPRTQTLKVSKTELRKAGITARTWDCEAHGFTVTRSGLKEGVGSA
jgi:carnitine-CoA ligase